MNSRKRNRGRRLNLFIGGLMWTACQHDCRSSSQRFVVDVILTVTNQSRRALHVSLQSDTLQQVLGDVEAGASRSFSVPSALAGSPSLAHLVAAGDDGVAARSEDFRVKRGDQVEWQVPATGSGALVRRWVP